MKVNVLGDKFWFFNDKFHRVGGLPAIDRVNGDKEWYVNGNLHRENDLPAYEGANGDRSWWVNGKLHRDGGLPAYEGANGDRAWYVNGERHRVGGLPAYERANGDKYWYVNGVEYYPDRWTQQQMTPDMVGQTCVISLETIQNDSEVCKCGVCHSLSLFGVMEKWLNVNQTCPHCRSLWTNWTKYQN